MEGPSLASRVEQRRGSDREILRSKFPLARFGRVTGLWVTLQHLPTRNSQRRVALQQSCGDTSTIIQYNTV